jgi:hypothetical protein
LIVTGATIATVFHRMAWLPLSLTLAWPYHGCLPPCGTATCLLSCLVSYYPITLVPTLPVWLGSWSLTSSMKHSNKIKASHFGRGAKPPPMICLYALIRAGMLQLSVEFFE